MNRYAMPRRPLLPTAALLFAFLLAACQAAVPAERGPRPDRVELRGAAIGGYLANRTIVTYLFDPDGKPLGMPPTEKGPEAVAAELERWVR